MGFHQFLHENVHSEEVFMGFHEMDLQHGLESCIFAIQFAGALSGFKMPRFGQASRPARASPFCD